MHSRGSTIQVKIKRKQHLLKKELEPIISDDDMKNAAQTEGMHTTFSSSYVFNFPLRTVEDKIFL